MHERQNQFGNPRETFLLSASNAINSLSRSPEKARPPLVVKQPAQLGEIVSCFHLTSPVKTSTTLIYVLALFYFLSGPPPPYHSPDKVILSGRKIDSNEKKHRTQGQKIEQVGHRKPRATNFSHLLSPDRYGWCLLLRQRPRV